MIVAIVLWTLVGIVALGGSLVFHFDTDLTRRAGRDLLNAFVTDTIEGRLEIGSIDVVTLDRVVAHDANVYDAAGNLVIHAEEAVVVPDLRAALRGTLRFSSARLTNGEVVLIEGQSQLPTLIEAFQPAHPGPPGGESLHAIVDDIEVSGIVVRGELLGLEGIGAAPLHARGRIEAAPDGELEVLVYSATADVTEPFPFVGHVERLSARIHTNPREGIRLHARGSVEREGGPTDRVGVNVTYRLPDEAPDGDPQVLDVLVSVDPADARVLPEIGFEWGDLLIGELRGHFRLSGVPDQDLALRVSAETDGGHARVTGTIHRDGTVEVDASSDALALERVVEGAPSIEVGGRVHMVIDGSDPDAPPRVHAVLEPTVYQRYAVPSLTIDGELLEDRFHVSEVTAPYSGGHVEGSGDVMFDGAVDLRLRGTIPQIAHDSNVRRLLPDARGSVSADVHLQTFGEDRAGLDFRGVITLRNFEYGPLTADWLRLAGSAAGDKAHPRVRMDVDGRGVAVADYPLGVADARVTGGPTQYTSSGTFATDDGRTVSFDAVVTAEGRTWVLDSDHIEYGFGGEMWRGWARRVVYDPSRGVDVQRIMLASGTQRLETWGQYGFHGPDTLEALLQDFDVAALRALVGEAIPLAAGRADAHVQLTGDVARPKLLIEGALRGGRILELSDVNASYIASYDEGAVSLDGQADLGDRGTLSILGTGMLDPNEPDPFVALEGGVYEMEADFGGLDLGVVRALLGERYPDGLEGRVMGTLRATGPIFAPNISTHLTVPVLLYPGFPPLEVGLDGTYDNGVLVGRVTTSDSQGELAEAEGSLLIDLVNLVGDPVEALETLDTLPWRISFRLPPRRLDALPAEARAFVPTYLGPLQVGASATLAGGGLPTQADLLVNAEWLGETAAPFCAGSSPLRANIEAQLRSGTTTTIARVFAGDARILSLEATAPTPLDAWVSGETPFSVPPTNVTAMLENAPSRELPWLCDVAEGPLTAVVQINRAFTAHPEAHVELHSNSLSVLSTQAIRGEATFDANSEGADARAEFGWWGGETATLDLAVPLRWGNEQWYPVLDDGDLALRAAFESAPLGPFITWLPQIAFAAGSLSGTLESHGPLDALETTGTLRVSNGYVEIESLGQHLSDVAGEVTFHGNWASLDSFEAHDGDGVMRLSGGIGFDGWFPARARLSLRSQSFPVRQEGSVLASLTGSAGLEATITEDATNLEIDVRSLSVELPDQTTRSVQELSRHPDVLFIDEQAIAEAEETPYPLRVHVNAPNPFWVRRSDFATQVSANIQATYRDPDLLVAGNIQLRRGFFEVFGKRFEVERGGMSFDGGAELDPEVNLSAVHHMRSPPNTDVSVSVNGRLSEPEIEFTSNHPDCDERAEIIAMLVSNRCGQRTTTASQQLDAQQQASGFLAGIAAGVLTLTARRELGNVVPVFIVESGDQAFQSARIRAGFNANDIIPDFLRGVVQGAYVEGIFTAGSDTQGNDAALLPGFLIELSFPAQLVGKGQYNPPNNWSIDLTWEP